MTIQFPDGKSLHALLLSVETDSVRAAVSGDEDVRVFTRSKTNWISDRGERVKLQFAWEQEKSAPIPDESHFVCPKHLAFELISRLLDSSVTGPCGEKPLFVFSAEDERVRITVLHGALEQAS
jgi:hypothetical protein